jgi:hypothetical protein
VAVNIKAASLTVTKLTIGGNFLFVFSDGNGPASSSSGQIRFMFSVPSADMATFAALGGGSSATRNYAENLNQGDYPAGAFDEAQ